MSNHARSLAYSIYCALQDEKNVSKICSLFGKTREQLLQKCENGFILTPREYEGLASILKKSTNQLLTLSNEDQYPQLVDCRGHFSTQKDCDAMLDLIDNYITIVEAVTDK